MEQILIVEDDTDINNMVASALTKAGYECKQSFSGTEAMLYLNKEKFSVIILDLMLPGKSGNSIVEEIKPYLDTSIIVVSAKDELDTKVNLLFSGADDYITKPFNILEVKARIKAILRRSNRKQAPAKPSNVMEINGMKVELDSRRVFVGGKELNLTAKEFDLLELLMAHPNKVYSRNELLNTIWGDSYPGDARTVDVHVRRLREKI